MATKQLFIHIDDKEVSVVLRTARKSDGIARAIMMTEATKLPKEDPKALVAFYLYPTCIAAVKEPQWVRDMSLDDFINLVDEPDIDTWVEEAYELNPQWKRSMQTLSEVGEPESKKTGTPSSG